jgi:hypothetical protein
MKKSMGNNPAGGKRYPWALNSLLPEGLCIKRKIHDIDKNLLNTTTY